MPDPLDDHVRRRMQQQRRRDTSLELAIRHRLHALGYRYRVDYRPEPSLRVRGDIVFVRRKVVIFIDGCFWHACPDHGTVPANNEAWWRAKLQANADRDRHNRNKLRELEWIVVSVWEHESAKAATNRITGLVGPPVYEMQPSRRLNRTHPGVDEVGKPENLSVNRTTGTDCDPRPA